MYNCKYQIGLKTQQIIITPGSKKKINLISKQKQIQWQLPFKITMSIHLNCPDFFITKIN